MFNNASHAGHSHIQHTVVWVSRLGRRLGRLGRLGRLHRLNRLGQLRLEVGTFDSQLLDFELLLGFVLHTTSHEGAYLRCNFMYSINTTLLMRLL